MLLLICIGYASQNVGFAWFLLKVDGVGGGMACVRVRNYYCIHRIAEEREERKIRVLFTNCHHSTTITTAL